MKTSVAIQHKLLKARNESERGGRSEGCTSSIGMEWCSNVLSLVAYVKKEGIEQEMITSDFGLLV